MLVAHKAYLLYFDSVVHSQIATTNYTNKKTYNNSVPNANACPGSRSGPTGYKGKYQLCEQVGQFGQKAFK